MAWTCQIAKCITKLFQNTFFKNILFKKHKKRERHFFCVTLRENSILGFLFAVTTNKTPTQKKECKKKEGKTGNVAFLGVFSFNFLATKTRHISTFSWFPGRHIVATLKLSIQLTTKPSGNETKSGIIDMGSIFIFTHECFRKYTTKQTKRRKYDLGLKSFSFAR